MYLIFFSNRLDRVVRKRGVKVLALEAGKMDLPFIEMKKMGIGKVYGEK